MDAGVLQLQVFEHQAKYQVQPVLADGEVLKPWLKADRNTNSSASEPISLVIPTFFNSSLKHASLGLLLDGIDECQAISEIVLVATDGVPSEIPEQLDAITNKPIRIAECPQNRRAQARNVGFEQATHDLVLFMDDDMLVHHWGDVDAIVAELLDGDFDAAMFPRRCYAKFPQLYNREQLDEVVCAWREHRPLSEQEVYDPVQHGAAYKTMAFCFPGCFMIIRKDAYEVIGGFPENFQGWGFEDSDFAIRATSVLRVLNLFRKSEPLLHIDHPVSPYKSQEYELNFKRFLETHSMSDVERLCESAIAGENYDGSSLTSTQRRKLHLHAVNTVMDAANLALDRQDSLREKLRRNYECILEIRMEDSQATLPKFGVLHGSRGVDAHTPHSDYDLLFLFQEGNLREYFADQADDGRSFEVEYADFGKFEFIARQPVKYPLYGPLEVAKLAQGKLLFGDELEWETWRSEQISLAVEYGRIYWMLYAVGMTLTENNAVSPLRDRFVVALSLLLEADAPDRFADEIDALRAFNLNEIGPLVRTALDREMKGWRSDLEYNRRYFAFQVPEVWTAMRWLVQNEQTESKLYASSSPIQTS